MLISEKQIRQCSIEGTDGTIGTVKDVLFDGRNWIVRYFDVDTGEWLPGRRIVFYPTVIQTADYATQRLVTSLGKEQVEKSPSVDSHLPVSRQKEMEIAQYYAWEAYWANVDLTRSETPRAKDDPELRSTQAVSGYHIQAMDGEIGHIADFIIDDGALEGVPWEIRYLVVDTGNWLPGKHVLVPPLWAESIDWNQRIVQVGLTREMVENSPSFDPQALVNRQYEEVFYDYYGRPRYWTRVGHPA